MATKKRPPPKPAESSTLVGADLYLKRLNADGTSTITHRVWDGERFFDNELKAARAEGLEVLLSSKAEYLEARQ